MKRSDLRAKANELGIEAEKVDELVNFIMDLNGKDINSTKAQFENELAEANKKVEDLTKANTELTTEKDSYKDKYQDYEKLKAFKNDYLANQEKQQKETYLKDAGCKHPELFMEKLDWSNASYDQDKKTYTGLDEALKGLKETYKDMFESKEVGDKFNPNLDGGVGSQESEFMKRYKAENPNLKF